MKHTSTFTIKTIALLSAICLFAANPLIAQEETSVDNTATQDSIKLAYKNNPFGIQIGLDIVKLGTFALDFETKYEGMVGVSYKPVTLLFEAGYGSNASDLAYKNSDDYEVEGRYYRVGLDYSFSLGANNQILLGLRYGSSTFGDQGTFKVESELWSDFETSVDRTGAEATWGEVVLGTQTGIAKNLYFGWYFRLRKIFERTSYEPIDIYYIPGYGKSVNHSVPALNLFLKYKISF